MQTQEITGQVCKKNVRLTRDALEWLIPETQLKSHKKRMVTQHRRLLAF